MSDDPNPSVTFKLPFSVNHVDTGLVVRHLEGAQAWLRGQHNYNAAEVVKEVCFAITGPHVPLAADRDPDLWHVQVTVVRPADNGWTAQRTLPTFTVDGAVHGIETHRGAATAAADILCVDLNTDWQYIAVVRNGGDDQVITFNLHNLGAAFVGDHAIDIERS